MEFVVEQSLNDLYTNQKLNKSIILWGISNQTIEVIDWLRSHGLGNQLSLIVDNFKYTFFKVYYGIPVQEPNTLKNLSGQDFVILLSVNYSATIRRQIEAYGISEVYNLRNLAEVSIPNGCNINWHFINRSKKKKYLCYILAGYESAIWDGTLGRIETYQSDLFDYCLVSSGKFDETLNAMAEKNDWSYLYTEENQVCFIQNKVIELHEKAEYIIKMDEDIFIGKNFYERMVEEFHRIEEEGEYRIGFAVPVIPLNCCGYATYLNLIDQKADYEEKFGRAYKSRFSAVFSVEETAKYLWDTMSTFDEMAERFSHHQEYGILDCYYNIGCIMYTRDRWLMMGKWPETLGQNGMGEDEMYIYKDNTEKDMSIYEIYSVLAGHLAFGHQKKSMLAYYKDNPKKFLATD